MLPSWIRSRNCRRRLVYFFAIEMTRRRLASHLLLGLARFALALLHYMDDLAEFLDLQASLARQLVDVGAQVLDAILSRATRFFQPLVESLETRLSQRGSSSEPR
jgi:hypothetical protein